MIAWVYGSGFPKSMNIGKSIEAKELTGSSNKTAFKYLDGKKTKVALGYNKNNKQGYFRPNDYNGRETTVDHILHTKNAKQWEGWGTALKPALEPITVARKPLGEKTVAENCLKWGVGGINIDGCRVGTTEQDKYDLEQRQISKGSGVETNINFTGRDLDLKHGVQELGRFPANLIHDGSDEVVELFPQTKGEIGRVGRKSGGNYSASSFKVGVVTETGIRDSGSASRFFYCAKASKRERNIGCEGLEEKIVNDGREKKIDNAFQRGATLRKNTHPTVKPLALMEYLVKLVSREGQVVLDPFMGSGTTGMACKKLDREFIGIEMMPEYMEIAKRRIGGVKKEDQLNMI
jgi:site-specific DNA-methyltransferase (adenine-specific)